MIVAGEFDGSTYVLCERQGRQESQYAQHMLYSGSDTPFPVRAQGAYISEDEAEKAAAQLRSLGKPLNLDILN